MNSDRVAELYLPNLTNNCGTGYLIGPCLVLTAKHVVTTTDDSVAEPIWVRSLEDFQNGRDWNKTDWSVCWRSEQHDLALLRKNPGNNKSFSPEAVRFSELDMETKNVEGRGFPEFKAENFDRAPFHIQAQAYLYSGGKFAPGQELQNMDGDLPKHPEGWGGMSGTAIFYEDSNTLVGVIKETNRGEITSNLWMTPISVIFDDDSFWCHSGLRKQDSIIYNEYPRKDSADNSEKLNKFLSHLNYDDQEDNIKSTLRQLNGAGIFLAEIADERIQRWMIARLMQNVGLLKGAVARHLAVSDLFYTRGGMPKSLFGDLPLTAICEKLETSSLLFTIREAHRLNPNDLSLLLDHWDDLKMMIESTVTTEYKCILLLVGDSPWIDDSWSAKAVNSKEYWKWGQITDRCINNWLDSGIDGIDGLTAGAFCMNLTGEPRKSLRQGICLGSPLDAIESISCSVLGENGFAQLEQHWRLGA